MVLELRKRSLMYIRLYRYGADLLDRKKRAFRYFNRSGLKTQAGTKENDKDLLLRQEESIYGGSQWESVLRGIDC